jgi:hypothetical protein
MEEMYLKEPFNSKQILEQSKHIIFKNICKDGHILKPTIFSLISIVIHLFLGYRTYCRLPKYLSNIFLIIFIIIEIIFLFELIYNYVSSKKVLEEKCVNMMIKSNNFSLRRIYIIISIILGFILIYYGFISLFMNMKLNNCPNNMFSTFSKK